MAFARKVNDMQKKIAFIGVGTMGRPMAMNLIVKGYKVTVFDIVKEKMDDLVKAGASAASSPEEAVRKADVVITMLYSSPHVETVVYGKDGILEGIRSGAVYIDMSTIDPVTTRKIALAMEQKGVAMLDAPVTRGVSAAQSGTLCVYVGGKKEVFESARDVLDAMGSDVYYMGDTGAGSVTKLVNNLCLGMICAATAEALVFGVKSGVGAEKLVDALAEGSGASFVLNKHIREYALQRKFEEVIFPVDFIMKDMALGLDTAKEYDMPLPLSALTHQIYAMLKAKDRGKGYFPEVVSIYEDYAGVLVEADK